MRRRLAELLSSVAASLLDAAHRLDPETVQIVEELADLAEPEAPSGSGCRRWAPSSLGPEQDAELVSIAPTREIAIGLAMADADPGSPIIVHNGGPSCTGDAGCGCGAVAYRADRGRA